MQGFNVLREVEKSMIDGSINETMSGKLPEASQKAYSVAQAQTNAKKLIGGVGKSLAESVVLFGDLMKDIALNHITVPQLDELVGGRMKMKYKTFLLSDKKSGGKMGDRLVKFDESLIGLELTEDEKRGKDLELLEESGYPNETKSIKLVNPDLFAKFNYLTKVDVEEMFTKSNEYWQPLLLVLKQQLANDPFVDQESLTRKLLYSYFNSEGEELMKEQSQQIPGLPEAGGAIKQNQASNNFAQNNAINRQVL